MPRVLGQPFDEVVEGEPDAPTVVIEGYGEEKRGHEEERENQLVIEPRDEARDVERHDKALGRDHVDENRADEKARLAHEERVAGRAVVLDLERPLDD